MRVPRQRWVAAPRLCAAAIGASLALGSSPSTAATRRTAPATDSSAAAKTALSRARQSARAGNFAAALVDFEAALALQPAPKLHFNIAVCHHRLLGAHKAGSEPYEHHRTAAVMAYNRYLQTAADPSDGQEVAALVTALGGTPYTPDSEPWTIERVEPGDVPTPPPFDGWDDEEDPVEPDPDANPQEPPHEDAAEGPVPAEDGTPPADVGPAQPPIPSPTRGPLTRPRGSIGGFIPMLVTSPGDLAQSTEFIGAPQLGLGLRGNAFLGPRRGVALGGEVALATQASSATKRHRVATAYFGILLGYRHPLDSGRLELGVDGVLGATLQSIVYDGDAPLRCREGRVASRRSGLWATPRMVVSVLLGRRRNHVLSARAGPGIAAYGSGSQVRQDDDENDCTGEPTAFEQFGLRQGAALVMTFDLGYAVRL